jgi:hypothetical protein
VGSTPRHADWLTVSRKVTDSVHVSISLVNQAINILRLALESYPGGTCSNFGRYTEYSYRGCSWYFSVPPNKCPNIIPNRPLPPPSKSFPIHLSYCCTASPVKDRRLMWQSLCMKQWRSSDMSRSKRAGCEEGRIKILRNACTHPPQSKNSVSIFHVLLWAEDTGCIIPGGLHRARHCRTQDGLVSVGILYCVSALFPRRQQTRATRLASLWRRRLLAASAQVGTSECLALSEDGATRLYLDTVYRTRSQCAYYILQSCHSVHIAERNNQMANK